MESNLLQTKDIGDFSSVTVRYFGSCTLGERPWAGGLQRSRSAGRVQAAFSHSDPLPGADPSE
jgi:putative IMPACT (imprinted ancient) family translation regulator